GLQSGNGDAPGLAAGLGPDRHRRPDIPHRVVREQYVVQQPFGFLPGSGLEYDAAKSVGAVRSAMRPQAGAIEKAVVHDEMPGGTDQADSIAGRVEDAARDHGVIPVTAGNGIISREELAAEYVHVAAPVAGGAPVMHAIPSTRDLNVPNLHIIADLEEDGVVGGIDDGDIPNREAAATGKGDRMRAAHVLLAFWVEHLLAINDACSTNGHIFSVLRHNQPAIPVAISGLGHERRCPGRLVFRQVGRSHQGGAGGEEKGHMAAQVDGAGKVSSWWEQHLSAAG